MTRREEITKASICQYQIIGTIGEQEAFKNGFVKGAEWADKTMIDKAAKWLQDQIFGQEILLYEEDIASFRKAMKE